MDTELRNQGIFPFLLWFSGFPITFSKTSKLTTITKKATQQAGSGQWSGPKWQTGL